MCTTKVAGVRATHVATRRAEGVQPGLDEAGDRLDVGRVPVTRQEIGLIDQQGDDIRLPARAEVPGRQGHLEPAVAAEIDDRQHSPADQAGPQQMLVGADRAGGQDGDPDGRQRCLQRVQVGEQAARPAQHRGICRADQFPARGRARHAAISHSRL